METKWFFAHGSLIWDKNFEYETSLEAEIKGYSRSFNKKSIKAWRIKENPTPVLGLEKEGKCKGILFKLLKEKAKSQIKNPKTEKENITKLSLLKPKPKKRKYSNKPIHQ